MKENLPLLETSPPVGPRSDSCRAPPETATLEETIVVWLEVEPSENQYGVQREESRLEPLNSSSKTRCHGPAEPPSGAGAPDAGAVAVGAVGAGALVTGLADVVVLTAAGGAVAGRLATGRTSAAAALPACWTATASSASRSRTTWPSRFEVNSAAPRRGE